MDSLVLDAHQNDPHIAVPVDLFLFSILYDVYHHFSYLFPVSFGILNGRPFVVRLIQIIPVHFINTDGKHSFVGLIDPLADKALVEELVNKECCSVSIVENQGVS